MERYNVILSQAAKADIRNAVRYVAAELREKATAERLLCRFQEALSSLETMPERFAMVTDTMLAAQGIRMMPIGNYLVFFTVSRSEKEVRVARALYGRRNWVELLGNSLSFKTKD